MAGITAIGYLVYRYTSPMEVRCFTLQAFKHFTLTYGLSSTNKTATCINRLCSAINFIKYGYVETEYHTVTVDTVHGGESGTLAATTATYPACTVSDAI
jgi:hypothetical protein